MRVRHVRLPPYVADSLLALVLGVPTVAGLVADEALEASPWLIGPLAALTALPLGVRRYWPLAVFVVTVAAWIAILLAGVDTFAPGVLVATYTLAAHCERRARPRRRRRASAAGARQRPLERAISRRGGDPDDRRARAADPRRQPAHPGAYYRELVEKAERLERERDESDRRAAAEEQARIARELHDVIAHNVSVMVLQAAGGREVIDADPRRAGEALAAIEAQGATRWRSSAGCSASSATAVRDRASAGLSHLDALVAQVRAAGLEAELELEGTSTTFPPVSSSRPIASSRRR